MRLFGCILTLTMVLAASACGSPATLADLCPDEVAMVTIVDGNTGRMVVSERSDHIERTLSLLRSVSKTRTRDQSPATGYAYAVALHEPPGTDPSVGS